MYNSQNTNINYRTQTTTTNPKSILSHQYHQYHHESSSIITPGIIKSNQIGHREQLGHYGELRQQQQQQQQSQCSTRAIAANINQYKSNQSSITKKNSLKKFEQINKDKKLDLERLSTQKTKQKGKNEVHKDVHSSGIKPQSKVKRILGKFDIALDDLNNKKTLTLYEGDDIIQIVELFCRENRLDNKMFYKLVMAINDYVLNHHIKGIGHDHEKLGVSNTKLANNPQQNQQYDINNDDRDNSTSRYHNSSKFEVINLSRKYSHDRSDDSGFSSNGSNDDNDYDDHHSHDNSSQNNHHDDSNDKDNNDDVDFINKYDNLDHNNGHNKDYNSRNGNIAYDNGHNNSDKRYYDSLSGNKHYYHGYISNDQKNNESKGKLKKQEIASNAKNKLYYTANTSTKAIQVMPNDKTDHFVLEIIMPNKQSEFLKIHKDSSYLGLALSLRKKYALTPTDIETISIFIRNSQLEYFTRVNNKISSLNGMHSIIIKEEEHEEAEENSINEQSLSLPFKYVLDKGYSSVKNKPYKHKLMSSKSQKSLRDANEDEPVKLESLSPPKTNRSMMTNYNHNNNFNKRQYFNSFENHTKTKDNKQHDKERAYIPEGLSGYNFKDGLRDVDADIDLHDANDGIDRDNYNYSYGGGANQQQQAHHHHYHSHHHQQQYLQKNQKTQEQLGNESNQEISSSMNADNDDYQSSPQQQQQQQHQKHLDYYSQLPKHKLHHHQLSLDHSNTDYNHSLQANDLSILKAIFNELDMDKDGMISVLNLCQHINDDKSHELSPILAKLAYHIQSKIKLDFQEFIQQIMSLDFNEVEQAKNKSQSSLLSAAEIAISQLLPPNNTPLNNNDNNQQHR